MVLDRNRGDFKPAQRPRELCRPSACATRKNTVEFAGVAALMPEAIDLLKSRRSVKPIELGGPGPTAAELSTLLTIASRVPDQGKLTP
jgi:hypothetical protein